MRDSTCVVVMHRRKSWEEKVGDCKRIWEYLHFISCCQI